jgi:predicted kinase
VNRLVLIRGLPGSGKSTIAKKMVAEQGFTHLEADMFFIDKASGEYNFDPKRLPEAHRWCQSEAFRLLQEGKNVVVSNTFTQRWEFRPYQDMWPNVEVKVATGSYQNAHGVTADKVAKMKARWED